MATETFTTPGAGTWTPGFAGTALVECWGAGGSSTTTAVANRAGGGGGGGAYAAWTITIAEGTEAIPRDYHVGAASAATAGADTWFNDPSDVLAKGGNASGSSSSAGAGGAAASCVGDVTRSGGNGGSGSSSHPNNGGGGGIDLAGRHHLAHQGQGFRRHGEALETGGEAGNPQDAQRILGKGRGDVTQHPPLQVLDAVVGIVQPTIFVLGDGIDGEIPAQQILL